MKGNKDLRITVILATILLLMFIFLPRSVIFNDHIICPTRFLFHLTCPLCGMTRATWLVMHLRMAEAWMYNPGVFPLSLMFGALVLAVLKGGWWERNLKILVWFCLGLVMIMWVLRIFYTGS